MRVPTRCGRGPSSDGAPLVADVSMGAVTYGDVLRGSPARRSSFPSAVEQRTRVRARARAGSSSSARSRAGLRGRARRRAARGRSRPGVARAGRGATPPRRRVAVLDPRPRRPTSQLGVELERTVERRYAPRRAGRRVRGCRRGGSERAGDRAARQGPPRARQAPGRVFVGDRVRGEEALPGDTSCWPGLPPTASTIVPAPRPARSASPRSRRNTAEPAGTSSSWPSSTKVARPATTTYSSSWPSRSSCAPRRRPGRPRSPCRR